MDALEYFKIKGEMTNTCKMKCDECPLYDKSNNKQLGCKRFEMLYPNEAIQIVERWEKEHPIMTNIENCKYKVVYMDKEEAEEIIKKIKEECDKHNRCNDCVFINICFS